jgi:hypothetical protein
MTGPDGACSPEVAAETGVAGYRLQPDLVQPQHPGGPGGCPALSLIGSVLRWVSRSGHARILPETARAWYSCGRPYLNSTHMVLYKPCCEFRK